MLVQLMVMWSAADPVQLSFSTNCFSIPTVTVAHILARLGGRWMILHPHRENDRCASVCVCVRLSGEPLLGIYEFWTAEVFGEISI